MFRRLRENGPALLVPAAWTLVLVAHLGTAGREPLTVAHGVMVVVIALFAALSWSDMADAPVLRAWRLVLVVGLPVTAAGLVGLLSRPPTEWLLAVAVLGWMALPAPALVYTGRRVGADEYPRVYVAGGTLAALGALVYAAGLAVGAGVAVAVVGIALVGVGQTAGILAAVVRY